MSAGAVKAGPRLCSVDGCNRPMQARGKCSPCWKKWARRNPTTRVYNLVLDTVEDCLPGHHAELINLTGLCEPTVRKALKNLKLAERAHIGYYLPPTVPGSRWKAVWVAGKGKDANLTQDMKNKHRLRGNRESYARRNSSGWAGPLGIRA